MARPLGSKRLTRIAIPVIALLGVLVLLLLPVACRQTVSYGSATDVDSNSLKQTAVVATLDCPLPEHKNAIWCSTFQMAWDRLKQDIIGEPLQIPEAQELTDRLNRSQFPTGSVEERSYYATAGFVKNGIIEQVEKEMRRRFPAEPAPTFDSRYTTLPDVILAYAYLNVDIGFKHPYCTCERGLGFTNSGGAQTNVTAFSAQTSEPEHAKDIEAIRDQTEVLYYDSGGSSGPVQFAVDLSKQTQPYQVILACLPRCNTLGEAAKMLQEKMVVFKNAPDYQAQSRLQSGDRLEWHFHKLQVKDR